MEKEKVLREYAQKRALVMGETRDDNIVMRRLETLNLQLTEAESERAAAEAKYRSVARANPKSIAEVQNGTAVRE
ncbi:MAG: hypothetical protein HC859_06135, partial [Bacteroidia bacterium]|nr:hypothetical protein [Bacteroidia bacterium]